MTSWLKSGGKMCREMTKLAVKFGIYIDCFVQFFKCVISAKLKDLVRVRFVVTS